MTDKIQLKDIVLVGSLPYPSVEEAFRAGAKLGDDVAALPDGEVGDRMTWVSFLPMHLFSSHPAMIETRSPSKIVPEPEDTGLRGSSREYQWTFQLKPEVTSLEFDDLLYGDIAIESYRTFKRLRDEGTIEPSVRFQVSLPSTSSAINQFFDDVQQWPVIHEAYRRGILTEIDKILTVVPAEDLLIQFDLAWEVNDLSIGDETYFDFWPELTYDEKFKRYIDNLLGLTNHVPAEVPIGIHWCYGTWGGWPMTAMDDMRLCVDLSNAAVSGTDRHIDYVHMPVILNPRAEFFAPLADLEIGDTKPFLGLLHHEDGIEGSRRRIELAKSYRSDFGLAAVCGYGREDPTQLGDVFALSRESARLLHQ